MQIRIHHLELTNFKCYRHCEFTFNDTVTVIRGRHGLGKTTVADAIFWCLFGKNSLGQANFSVKTKDAEGLDIPNLDHAVEMTLLVTSDDGTTETVTLRRAIKEVWTSKRGTTERVLKSNTTEYLVNGEVLTAKDYEAYINGIVTEELFRTITNPNYFPSLNWKRQREFLINLAGKIPQSDVADEDQDLLSLIKQLEEEKTDIEAHRKHLSYQLKKVNEQLDNIPVRLEEQDKTMPERLDWPALAAESETTTADIEKTEAEILAIRSGNGADIQREHIRAEIASIQHQLDQIEQQERTAEQQRYTEHSDTLRTLTTRFNTLLATQRDLETSIASFDTLISRCRQTADDNFKKEQAYIRQHWPDTQADFRQSESTVCPICHQPLPPDMLQQAEEQFNLRKAELKQQLTQRAADAKNLLAEAEQQVKDYERQQAEAQKKLEETKQAINDTFSEKAGIERTYVQTAEEALMQNEQYTSLLSQKSTLNDQLHQATTSEDDEQRLADLEAQKAQLKAHLTHLTQQLSTKDQYDRIQQRIAEIKEQEHQLLIQRSDLERREDIARRYQNRQNQIIEERVNRHFTMIRWRMFRTVNNAGNPVEEPYCECYVGGIAYHDGLNYAHRMNAGIDIIRTLCRYYNVFAPIVIDNAESNLDILQTDSQQIRLQVYDSDLQVI